MSTNGHRNALKPGYRVHWYRIEEILGQGGFGITYLAEDTNLHQQVALKEYLPLEVAVREGDFSVHPVSENHSDSFTWGLERFIDEARTLAHFDHPNIVRVFSVFEMNNTAYMVMRYETGRSLQQMLSKRETLDEAVLVEMLFPILDGLEQVHQAGFIHRDIKPGNVYIREDGTPVLLDFGSARQSLGEATRTLTTLVSPGYAPFEQYFSKSDRQGPWTDIYGLGATLYRAVVGVAPMNAVDRSEGIIKNGEDPMVPASEAASGRYSRELLQAIDWSLRFGEEARPQSIAAWRSVLQHGASPPPAATSKGSDDATALAMAARPAGANVDLPLQATSTAAAAATEAAAARTPKRSRRRYWIAAAACAVLLLALNGGRQNSDRVPAGPASAAPAAAGSRTDDLLRPAARDVERQHLSTPPGDNALEKYLEVLKRDPGNQAARQGIRGIVEAYAELGKQAAKQKNYQLAGRYLDRALAIAPDSKPLKKARARLDTIQQRKRR